MALAFAGAAQAQEAADKDQDGKEIVVTGTLVRGVAPAGANVVSVNSKAIEETGATSVAQVLQTIPQLASFGKLQQPLANSPEVAVNRPNLRNLPGFNSAGGSSTLVLMDGHRFVGVGIASTSPDPDVIPPSIIERVEIVPDGGSAIYGSDAVAGVMNFITIKRFNGLKVDGSLGFADRYYQWDASATAGKDWGSGSIFIAYNYAKTDQLIGLDRDYVREFPNASTGLTTLSCGAGNIQSLFPKANGGHSPLVVGIPFNGSYASPNAPIQGCDSSDYATVFPASQRHSVFAGLTQQLDDATSIDLRAYYTNRQTHIVSGPFRSSQIITSFPGIPGSARSPFAGLTGNSVDPVEQVYFQFGANDVSHSDIELNTWGVNGALTRDLGKTFRLRVTSGYGESITSLIGTSINSAAQINAIKAGTRVSGTQTVTGGLLNPFNLTDASTPYAQTLAAITNWESYNKGWQSMWNSRAIIDGDLFTLPGGAVKVAVGGEYSQETLRSRTGGAVPGYEATGFAGQTVTALNGNVVTVIPATTALPLFNLGRNVKSAFGELVVPIFGADNATTAFQQLTLSVAGRYDDYSDFGDTFNPRVGATWKPIDWLSLRGAWGKSFNAPSLADDPRASLNTLFVLNGGAASAFAPPASIVAASNGTIPAYNNASIVALRGNKPGIKPQTAHTLSFGFDMQPPVVPGLSLSATWYSIDFKNFIGLPPFENNAVLWRDYQSVIAVNPGAATTPAQIAQLAQLTSQLSSAISAANLISDGSASAPITSSTSLPTASTTYAYFDARKQNVGDVKASGIDFSVNYQHPTGFGDVFFTTSGTYTLHFKLRPIGVPTYSETITSNNSRLFARTTLGVDIGALQGQVTWNYRQGYNLDPVVGFVPQSHVGAFNTFDLFFRYSPKGDGLMKDLSFTLNVNNVFDQDPPEYRGSNSVAGAQGYANGATLGRLVQFGVSKKF